MRKSQYNQSSVYNAEALLSVTNECISVSIDSFVARMGVSFVAKVRGAQSPPETDDISLL